MQRSRSVLFAGLLAAPLMLASSAAMAGGDPNACFLTSATSCEFDVTGGCSAECTPGNFTANCETQCQEMPQTTCVDTCQTSCEASCTANPGSFDCSTSCVQDCQPQCTTLCASNSDVTACETACSDDCQNRCTVNCSATPPSVDCTVGCQTSCGTSCTVQENVTCQTSCVAQATLPECQAACELPTGALFCTDAAGNKQYIDLNQAASDCLAYVASLNLTATGSCNLTGCTGSVGCSAAPTLGEASDRWGVAGIAGLMMGLGLFVSRRKRK